MEKPIDNLTACAIAARSLGISYGQYMAQKQGDPITPKPVKRVQVVDMHYCKECGNAFECTDKHRLYCSDDCRDKATRRRDAASKRRRLGVFDDDVLLCPYCKTEFVRGNKHGSRKYCSTRCANEMHKAMDRARRRGWKNDGQT